MSNKIEIQRTIFQNVGSEEKTYGYRAYDDYGCDYCNTMDEADMKMDPLDFFHKVIDQEYAGEVLTEMVTYVEENGKGLSIDREYFIAEQLGLDGN